MVCSEYDMALTIHGTNVPFVHCVMAPETFSSHIFDPFIPISCSPGGDVTIICRTILLSSCIFPSICAILGPRNTVLMRTEYDVLIALRKV